MTRGVGAIIAFTLAALAVVLGHSWHGRPQAGIQPGIDRLACVSYANRESMFLGAPEQISATEIEADLRQIQAMSDCVRTYHTDRGQDQVVAIAARLGMKVVLGAAIGRDRDRNRAEIERAVAVARAHPGTVRLIVIGNEVLLRRDLSMAEMERMVAQVREGAGVPVTTAEIWSAWLRHPELAGAVDVVTVHILPYWDIQADSMAEVLAFTEASVKRVAEAYPDKPIFIGEVGWPSQGRARGGVVPGLVEQAEFLRGLVAMAARNTWSYNAIEAFDQPWKRRWEGAVGGYWGVLDADGAPKWPLAGAVSANPHWPAQAAAAIVLGAGLLLAALVSARGGRRWWLAAVLAPVAGVVLVQQALLSAAIVARPYEPVLAVLAVASASVYAVLGLAVAAGRSRWDIPGFADVMAGGGRRLGRLTLAVRVGAASLALALLFDPRHRDFHTVILALPALVLAAAAVRMENSRSERVLGWVLGGAGIAVAIREGHAEALGWAAVCLAMALPMVVKGKQQAQDRGRGVGEGVAERQPDDAHRHGDNRAKAPAEAG